MKKHAYIIFGLLITLTLAVGCKKSVKGETSRWKSANKSVDQLASMYPKFKKPLEEQRAKATVIYKEAQSIDDEKQKISKLAEANKVLSGGFVAQLGEVDGKIKALRAKLVEAAGTTDPGMKAKVEAARTEVDRTLDKVKKKLKKGAKKVDKAALVINEISNELVAAEQIVAKVMPEKPAPAAGAAAGGTAGAKTAGAPVNVPDTKAEPAQWSCEFCDHKNEGAADKCSNCGAARGSKPDKKDKKDKKKGK